MHTRSTTAAFVGAMATLMAAPAFAANIVFSDVTAVWSDAVISSPAGLSISGNNTGHATVSWGVSTGYGKSSYSFDSVPVAPIDVPPAPGSSFVLGQFTHNNKPITGADITAVKLTLTADVSVDGVSQGPLSLVYNFTHHETPNQAQPCAYGGANGQGINKYGCADKVTMNYASASDLIQVGSDFYTFSVGGFLVNGNPVEQFITKEKKSNVAYLMGRLDFHHTAVPEPATWAMLILGFSGVGAALRGRRGAVAAG